MDDKNNRAFKITAVLLIIFGIVMRILFFSYLRPFWNDESALALNIINRSFLGLLAPLDYNQVTPFLYDCLCKFFGLFSANKEFAFRLPSLFFGVLSVPLFYLFSKKILKSKLSVVFAMMLFSLNYKLIYYCQEFKQYSFDVFIFIALLFSYFYFDKEDSKPKLLLSGAVLALLPWMSYTSLSALAVLFILLALKNKKMLLPLFSLPVLSSVLLLFYVQRLHFDSFLNDFWANGFISKDFSNLFSLITNNLAFYFAGFPNKILIIAMFLAGFIAVLKTVKNEKSLILFSPILIAFIMSYFSIYPMYLRTSLYLFPDVILVMAKPFDYINFKNKYFSSLFIIFIFLHFFAGLFKTDYVEIIKKQYYKETTPSLLQAFEQMSKEGDILIVPLSSNINFEYYKRNFDLNPQNIYVVQKELYEAEDIKKAYDTLPEGKTYYILMTHSGDKPSVYKNMCIYAQSKKNSQILSDKNLNALIKLEN